MLTFKWGVPNGKNSVRFWDGTVDSISVEEHETLYSVGAGSVSVVLWDNDGRCVSLQEL